MHFWIDKRSSQLHQYGGGRRAASGGFYSQNFGTHRASHHPPPPSLCHHPHRIRTRSTATNASTSSSINATNNNNVVHTMSITSNINNNHPASSSSSNGNSVSSAANIALQYPHQQPHQVQGQHMLLMPEGDDEAVNPSNISSMNINPDSSNNNVLGGGGIDLSWRNPYHVPGSSSRGTRGRRTSSSFSSNSQNASNETPVPDRSSTVTPQRSLSLTSPETVEHSTGHRPSLENDPGWACTKRVGLTLCFLAFILLGTVGAKFMIQGPGVIDTSRTGKAEAAAYFLFTELIFVAFAMALFFTGVACLRKRTNDYLLRQFNQYILSSSGPSALPGAGGNALVNLPPGQDAYDFEYYDGTHLPTGSSTDSPSRAHHHHHLHHNLHHGGFHHFRHNPSNEGDFGSGSDLTQSPHNFHGAGPIHYPALHGGSGASSSSSSRHGRSKPPPYHIALYLPLPEGMGGESSPIDGKSNKFNGASNGIRFIDSSSIKDAQDAAGGNNVNFGGASNPNAEDRGSNQTRNGGTTEGNANHNNRSETPPPPYEQI